MIFPTSIFLKENKRLKTEESKQLLAEFKTDLLNTKDKRGIYSVIKKIL